MSRISDIKKLKTEYNSLGKSFAKQFISEITDYIKSHVSKMEVVGMNRKQASDTGVTDIVISPNDVNNLMNCISELDLNVTKKGKFSEFSYKGARFRVIVANKSNFKSTVEWIKNKMYNNYYADVRSAGYKINKYGVWKEDKLVACNEKEVQKLLTTKEEEVKRSIRLMRCL